VINKNTIHSEELVRQSKTRTGAVYPTHIFLDQIIKNAAKDLNIMQG